MGPKTVQDPLARWKAWSVIFLLGSYPLFVLHPPVGIAVGALAAVCSLPSKKRATLVFLLSPLVGVTAFSFGQGACGYFNGTGTLKEFGSPPTVEFDNLDPHCRCRRTNLGCVPHRAEPFTQVLNNFAIRLLTDMIGPMRGTYHGPYPTPEEAFRAIADTDQIIVSSEVPAWAAGVKLLGEVRAIRRAEFKGETIIMGGAKAVVLADRNTGEKYATYDFRYRGWRQLSTGAFDAAIAEFTENLSIDSEEPEFLVGRAVAYGHKGDFPKAIADYQKALGIAPPNWWRRQQTESNLKFARSSKND